MRLSQILKEPRFASDLERRFTLIFIDRCERSNAIIWMHGNYAFWIVSILAGVAAGFDPNVFTGVVIGGAAMTLLSLAALTMTRKTQTLRRLQLAGFVGCSVICWVLALLDASDGVGNRGLAALWITGATLGIGLLAFRNWIHIGVVIVITALYAHGLKDYPEPFFGWLFGTTLLVMFSNAQIFLQRIFKYQAMDSFRQQSKFTPKQIIVRAIELETPASEIFTPTMRFCACICSDWRGFQQWAIRTPPAAMAATLSAYYTLQIQLLDEVFPEGNYFLDWIADELFVVAFTTDSSGPKDIARASLAFAQRSVDARPQFAREHGVPVGVDVGVAFGQATVGILGPDGNAKATAFGEVPGSARRLQTAAKALRKKIGDGDRILVHPIADIFISTEEFGLREFTLGVDSDLRDLSLRRIYVGTPTGSESTTPQQQVEVA